MLKKMMLGLLFSAGVAWSGVAAAQDYLFSLTGSYNAQWTLAKTPVPSVSFLGQGFIVNDVRGRYDGITGSLADIDFYNSALGGGLEIDDPARGDLVLLVSNGAQLYSGSEAAPSFLTGSYTLTQDQGPGLYNLSIQAIAAVPEPATWGLMILGFGVVGGVQRRLATKARHNAQPTHR